jgi:hypothetical protein
MLDPQPTYGRCTAPPAEPQARETSDWLEDAEDALRQAQHQSLPQRQRLALLDETRSIEPRQGIPMSRKTDSAARPPLVSAAPQVQTKFLRLRQAVPVGHCIDGWRVTWAGGWDRGRVFFVVMVAQTKTAAGG